jgi:hypothetical protein
LNNTDQKNTHVNQQLKIPLELNSTGSIFFPRGMIVHHEVVEQHGPEEYSCQPAAQDSTRTEFNWGRLLKTRFLSKIVPDKHVSANLILGICVT